MRSVTISLFLALDLVACAPRVVELLGDDAASVDARSVDAATNADAAFQLDAFSADADEPDAAARDSGAADATASTCVCRFLSCRSDNDCVARISRSSTCVRGECTEAAMGACRLDTDCAANNSCTQNATSNLPCQ